jgi:hypothetical protein
MVIFYGSEKSITYSEATRKIEFVGKDGKTYFKSKHST